VCVALIPHVRSPPYLTLASQPAYATMALAKDEAIQMVVRSPSFGRQYLRLVSKIDVSVGMHRYLLFRAKANESGPKEPLCGPKKSQTRNRNQRQPDSSLLDDLRIWLCDGESAVDCVSLSH
jgi:hypothetical protein